MTLAVDVTNNENPTGMFYTRVGNGLIGVNPIPSMRVRSSSGYGNLWPSYAAPPIIPIIGFLKTVRPHRSQPLCPVSAGRHPLLSIRSSRKNPDAGLTTRTPFTATQHRRQVLLPVRFSCPAAPLRRQGHRKPAGSARVWPLSRRTWPDAGRYRAKWPSCHVE